MEKEKSYRCSRCGREFKGYSFKADQQVACPFCPGIGYERELFIRTYPFNGLAERLMRKEKEDRLKEILFEDATYEEDIKSTWEGKEVEEW